jgi:hypothetical protein
MCLFPALPFWRREKYRAPAPPPAASAPVQHAATSNGSADAQASHHDKPARTSS